MEKRETHSLRENPSALSHSPKTRDTNQERATNCIGSTPTPCQPRRRASHNVPLHTHDGRNLTLRPASIEC